MIDHTRTKETIKLMGDIMEMFAKAIDQMNQVNVKYAEATINLAKSVPTGNIEDLPEVKELKDTLESTKKDIEFDNEKIIDSAPDVALGNLLQAVSQALGNAAHNGTTQSQNQSTILQATTTQGAAIIYSNK